MNGRGYKYNEDTFSYEVPRRTKRELVLEIAGVVAGGIILCALYVLLADSLNWTTPKSAVLNSKNLKLSAQRDDLLTRVAILAQIDTLIEEGPDAKVQKDIPSIYPVEPAKVHVSSTFGLRMHPITHEVGMHPAIDLGGPSGLPVFVTAEGVVISVNYSFTGYGNCVVVDHCNGYQTRYAHLESISVYEGQQLKQGDQIGKMGNTGMSTGPHLHYEVIYEGKRINPWQYLGAEVSSAKYRSMVHPTGGGL